MAAAARGVLDLSQELALRPGVEEPGHEAPLSFGSPIRERSPALVAGAPVRQLDHERDESDTALGQLEAVLASVVQVFGALDDLFLLQVPEPRGEDVRGDALVRSHEFAVGTF